MRLQEAPQPTIVWQVLSRRRLLNAVFVLSALVVGGLVARHYARAGWPLHNANVWLVALAALIFLAAYAAKAWGWQRLFSSSERPAVLTLAAAGGAASVGGIALPGRCDDVIRLAVVRRCRRRRASVGAAVLSIFLLALLDSAALAPLAYVAALVANVGEWLRAGLFVVAAAGVAAAAVVLSLRKLAGLRLVARFRIARFVGEHATGRREAMSCLARRCDLLGPSRARRVRAPGCSRARHGLRARPRLRVRLVGVCGAAGRSGRRRRPGGRRRGDPDRLRHAHRRCGCVRRRRAGARDRRGGRVRARTRCLAPAGKAGAGSRAQSAPKAG